jgi:hypothetical protein
MVNLLYPSTVLCNNELRCFKKGISSTLQTLNDYVIEIPKGVTQIAFNFSIAYPYKIEKIIDVKLQDILSQYNDIKSTVKNGFYNSSNVFTANDIIHSYVEDCKSGDRFLLNYSSIAGGCSMVYIFDSSNNLLKTYDAGTIGTLRTYNNYVVKVPTNGSKVIFNFWVQGYINIKKSRPISNINPSNKYSDKDLKYGISWRNRKIAYFGTSIPAGGGIGGNYPQIIGTLLGANVINEAVGSSCVRAGAWQSISGTDTMGYGGMYFENLMRSLSLSSTEKQSIFDNWSTWKTVIINAPDVISDMDKTFYKSCSYDIKLDKYLTANNFPDLFIFDHGHNEHTAGVWGDEMLNVPTNENDRSYAIGAMNFIIYRILDCNPKAKIAFIGHYENSRKLNISMLQKKYNEIWCYPLEKTWENTGWTQKTVKSKGAWVNGYWIENSLTTHSNYTMTQIWMPDDLHPHSDLSGNANRFLAEIHARWISTL